MVKFCAVSILLLLSARVDVGQTLERVSASDFFDSHAGSIVYIEVADSQVLVFDAADNAKYILHGRPLEIRAKTIELTGAVVVLSFGPEEHGPDTSGQPLTQPGQPPAGQGQGTNSPGFPGAVGLTGKTGDVGKSGAPAAPIRLFLENVLGDGNITFNDEGMKGGKGQMGGIGGNGGHGGKGHDRGKCDGSDSPSSGGSGGDGGIGGQGGPGGPGGKSGNIEFGKAICTLNSRIKLLSPKSRGGDGGEPGMGGANGGAGDGGSGMGCVVGNGDGGSASNVPGADRSHSPGDPGVTGDKGPAGNIVCKDCSLSASIDDSGVISCPQ